MAVGIGGLIGSLVVLCGATRYIFGGTGRPLTHFLSNQLPVHGRVLGIAWVADPFGLVFALLTTGLGIILLISVLSELGGLGLIELGGLACLIQLLLAALIGAALTADTVNLFVWFEVAALASYGLTGFFLERPVALEAAFKNLVLTGIAGFCVFVGSALLYATTGALNFGQLHRALSNGGGAATLIALALLISGLSTKAGLVPFHAWLPDAHTPIPGAVSALFSALMVDLGVVALARLMLQVCPDIARLPVLLMCLGLVSAVTGSLLALVQDDLKRLLAWDTVAQTGVMITGLASRTVDGVAGAVYHLVNHGMFKALMFLCAGAVVHATGVTTLDQMGGLARRRPLLTAAFTVGVLSISGVPLFNGYPSLGMIHDGLAAHPAALACSFIAQVLTVAALGRAAYLGFYRRREHEYEHLEPIRAGMRTSLILLGSGCVAFGALAGPFVARVAGPAAAGLLDATGYASAALGAAVEIPYSGAHFDYLRGETLVTVAAELVLGVILLILVIRRPAAQSVLGPLRRLHTGSINDYAAFAAVGLIVVSTVLLC